MCCVPYYSQEVEGLNLQEDLCMHWNSCLFETRTEKQASIQRYKKYSTAAKQHAEFSPYLLQYLSRRRFKIDGETLIPDYELFPPFLIELLVSNHLIEELVSNVG
jgi:hypothetical protein